MARGKETMDIKGKIQEVFGTGASDRIVFGTIPAAAPITEDIKVEIASPGAVRDVPKPTLTTDQKIAFMKEYYTPILGIIKDYIDNTVGNVRNKNFSSNSFFEFGDGRHFKVNIANDSSDNDDLIIKLYGPADTFKSFRRNHFDRFDVIKIDSDYFAVAWERIDGKFVDFSMDVRDCNEQDIVSCTRPQFRITRGLAISIERMLTENINIPRNPKAPVAWAEAADTGPKADPSLPTEKAGGRAMIDEAISRAIQAVIPRVVGAVVPMVIERTVARVAGAMDDDRQKAQGKRERNVFQATDTEVYQRDPDEGPKFHRVRLSKKGQGVLTGCLKDNDNLIDPISHADPMPFDDLVKIWRRKDGYRPGLAVFTSPIQVNGLRLFVRFHQDEDGDIARAYPSLA
jgi:hypothetical protein